METKRGRWITGIGTALATFVIGAAVGPGNDVGWLLALTAASVLLLVGIGARI